MAISLLRYNRRVAALHRTSELGDDVTGALLSPSTGGVLVCGVCSPFRIQGITEWAFALRSRAVTQLNGCWKKLQTSPTGIFPSAFSGYLLFLFTGRERKIIQQFRNEINDLDLTGETLAFAIFVERLLVKITDVTSGNAGYPATKEFDAAALKSYYSISGLVKAGRVGWVTKDTELVALTSATNKIATELGVDFHHFLASLPSMAPRIGNLRL